MKKGQNISSQGVGETLKDLGKDIFSGTTNALKDITVGAFDQLLDIHKSPESTRRSEASERELTKKTPESVKKREIKVNLFDGLSYKEKVVIPRRIKQLIEEIRAEAEALKKATSTITAEIREIEKVALENLPEKVGVYHVRFLEVVLKLVKSLRAKASESKVWLEALLTRRGKRGSLFLALSKKKGTQYSLSEELKMTRSIQ